MQSRLLFLLAISGLAGSTVLSACSGSSSRGGAPSSGSSGGGADGSSVGSSGSGPFGSSSGAGSGSGTGASSGSSGAGGSAAPCMAPSTVPSSELLPYATVQQQLNACNSTQISAFISACVPPSGSPSKCKTWEPSNAKCAACIMPANDAGIVQNTGAGLFDVRGNLVDYNFGGCIELIDRTSGGVACAQALDTYVQCIDFACEPCTDQTSTTQCQSRATTQGGACSSYNDAYHTPCKTDLAVDGGGTTKCSTGPQTINVICGTGM